MQLGFEAVCLDLDFTAPTINSPRLSSLFAFFLYKLRNKGILTYWLGFLPYWNDEKTLKFILGMLVRKKTSGYVCLMASLTSFKRLQKLFHQWQLSTLSADLRGVVRHELLPDQMVNLKPPLWFTYGPSERLLRHYRGQDNPSLASWGRDLPSWDRNATF